MLEIWEDKFILTDIIDSIIYYNANQYKHKGYMTDLNDGNFKNDHIAAIAGTGIEKNHINSSYICNDINNQWQNPNL